MNMQNIEHLENYINDMVGDDFLENYLEERDNLPAYEYLDLIWNAFEIKYPRLAQEYNNESNEEELYSEKEIKKILKDQLNDFNIFAKIFKDICFNFNKYSCYKSSSYYDYINIFLNMFKEGYNAKEIIKKFLNNPNKNIGKYNYKQLYNFIDFIVNKLYFQYMKKHNVIKQYKNKYYL